MKGRLPIQNLLKTFSALAAWLLLGFIAYATLSPLSARPALFSIETSITVAIERFGAYGLLGLLFAISYPRRLALVVVVVVGSAIGLELLQLCIVDRDARIIDVIEKLAGGLAGIAAGHMLSTLCSHIDLRASSHLSRGPD